MSKDNPALEKSSISFLQSMKKNNIIKKLITIIFVGILLIIFNSVTNQTFMSSRNLTLLLRQASVLMVIASTLFLLLVSRNFDLSAGAALYLVGVIVAKLIVHYEFNIGLTLIIAAVAGVLMGTVQGFFIGYIGIPAFIVTLAGQLVFRGTGYVITDAATIGPMPAFVSNISEGYINPTLSVVIILGVTALSILYLIYDYKKLKRWYGNRIKLITKIITIISVSACSIWVFGTYRGIPLAVFFAGIVTAIIGFISKKTVFGKQIFIIGGNPEAARLSGIQNSKRIFQAYMLMGLSYGLSGILLTARLGGSAATAGNLVELDAVAAAVIGGTSMAGGVGRITGVIFGVIMLSSIDNVMSLMNVSSYLQMVIKGLILLTAVSYDAFANLPKFKQMLRKMKGRK